MSQYQSFPDDNIDSLRNVALFTLILSIFAFVGGFLFLLLGGIFQTGWHYMPPSSITSFTNIDVILISLPIGMSSVVFAAVARKFINPRTIWGIYLSFVALATLIPLSVTLTIMLVEPVWEVAFIFLGSITYLFIDGFRTLSRINH